MRLSQKYNLLSAARRKFHKGQFKMVNGVVSGYDPYTGFSCTCGNDEADHSFVAEITDMDCTIIMRCPDGELTAD